MKFWDLGCNNKEMNMQQKRCQSVSYNGDTTWVYPGTLMNDLSVQFLCNCAKY